MIGIGLLIYCYFSGPAGFRRPRPSFSNFAEATKAAALPMMIPIILLAGIMTGGSHRAKPGLSPSSTSSSS
jgi:C4-dicarboxylate transporter, DctM subunit